MEERRTYEVTEDDITQLVSHGVAMATEDLKKTVASLKKELREGRTTLTLEQALTYFGGNISARILKRNYIRGKNLPKGVGHPLPARKVGSTYFVERETLEAWLLGRTTEADLYPWQKRLENRPWEGKP